MKEPASLSNGMIFRLADEADVPVVHALLKKTIESAWLYGPQAIENEIRTHSLDSLREDLLSNRVIVTVAQLVDNVVSFILFEKDDGPLWIDWMGTDPEFRGQGHSRNLLKFSINHFHTMYSKIWCDTLVDNVDARRVLEKNGFMALATLRNHWYGKDYHLWERFI